MSGVTNKLIEYAEFFTKRPGAENGSLLSAERELQVHYLA